MNKTSKEVKEFFEEFSKKEFKTRSNTLYGVAVPSCNIPFAIDERVSEKFIVAAQDVSKHLSGAFTGEISILMLKDLGVSHVIIGHSERRIYHGETDQDVNEKAKIALEHGVIPIICVGETLEQYESKQSKEIVEKQVRDCVKDLDLSKIIIAYEPV